MKNGRDSRAPLSAIAKAIVDPMPRLGEYLFTTSGKKPIANWGHVKARLDKLMSDELGEPVTEWRLHDSGARWRAGSLGSVTGPRSSSACWATSPRRPM